MTERKPPGMGFESWIDKQIREAMERGEFDNLPGHGKPIPGLDRPDDDWWWIGPKLRRGDGCDGAWGGGGVDEMQRHTALLLGKASAHRLPALPVRATTSELRL